MYTFIKPYIKVVLFNFYRKYLKIIFKKNRCKLIVYFYFFHVYKKNDLKEANKFCKTNFFEPFSLFFFFLNSMLI